VERRANPSFVPYFRIGRAQIYADMSLRDLARNLTVFHDETLLPAFEPGGTRAPPAGDGARSPLLICATASAATVTASAPESARRSRRRVVRVPPAA